MIQLEGVTKAFRIAPGPRRRARTIEAVRAITAGFEAGLVTGVVGPNGAGKTTLFALVLGFLEPTSGAIRIAGLDPRLYVRRHGACYLPERFQLPRDWTIRAALDALISLEHADVSVDKLLEDFALADFASAPAHTLSRGTMQRVGIAQAVAVRRELVVFDEPTEGLDPIWRMRFRDLVGELRSPNRTVLIASHDLSEIERLADRVVILRDGAIAETVDMRPHTGHAREYTIALAAPHASVAHLFEHVRSTGDASYAVTVADASDLSARVSALIDSGATIISVAPASGLEERVTRPSTDGA